MTSDRVARIRAQRARLASSAAEEKPARRRTQATAAFLPEDDAAPHPVLAAVRANRRRATASADRESRLAGDEADRLLAQLSKRWDQDQVNLMLAHCRHSVLFGIAGPFGLGAIAGKFDKDGGNVTTVHNARKQIYADDADRYANNKNDYLGPAYRKNSTLYKQKMEQHGTALVQDQYSGNLHYREHIDCDHIYPKKTFHDEGGYILSKQERAAFAGDEGNFATTHRSGNRSLGESDKIEWGAQTARRRKGEPEARPDASNKERFGHDNRRVNAAVRRGAQKAAEHLPTNTEKTLYFAEHAARTGVTEAGKMGMQQAFGMLLSEFLSASFDEIADAYKSGLRGGVKDMTFKKALGIRLRKIAARVAAEWKNTLAAFGEGVISGFLSNLVTVLVNMVATTAKRIVRVIREGFMAILRALKMALFPPKSMAKEEARDAALKLLATGVIVGLGIVAEEVIEKLVQSALPGLPVAMITTVLVSSLTGIATALVVYAIDKMDIFDVNAGRKHAYVMQQLDSMIEQAAQSSASLHGDEMGRTDGWLARLHSIS